MEFFEKLEKQYNTRLMQEARRKQFKEWKATLSCIVCGESEPCTFDFHHKDPAQKERTISSMAANTTWKTLQKEAAKCVVLCANCHRKFHAGVIELPIS
jgi:hypothetical protein